MAIETPNQIGIRIAELEKNLVALLKERQDAEQLYREGTFARKSTHEKSTEEIQEKQQAANEEHQQHFKSERERFSEKSKRRTVRINEAFTRLQEPILRERRLITDKCQNAVQEAQDKFVEEEKQKWAELTEQHDAIITEFGTLREKAHALKARIEGLATALGAGPEEGEESLPEVEEDKAEARPFLDRKTDQMLTLTTHYQALRFGIWASLGRRVWSFFVTLAVVVGHVAVFWFIINEEKLKFLNIVYLASSLLLSLLVLYFLTKTMRARTGKRAAELYEQARDLLARLVKQEQVEKDRHWAQYRDLIDERIARVTAAEEKINSEAAERREQLEEDLNKLRQRYERLKENLRISTETGRDRLQKDISDSARQMAEDHEAQWTELNDKHAQMKAHSEERRKGSFDRTGSEWKEGLDGLQKFSEEAIASSLSGHQPWETLVAPEGKLAHDFPEEVMVGKIELPLPKLDVPIPEGESLQLPGNEITLPLSLTFPGSGSLLVQAGAARRNEALEILFNTSLRVLTSFPPGMARLTVVDPVGLGQDFSSLMQLADHDEELIGGRIWTDAGHIEKRLSELTEHMEKVIQKYLRNRYATIGEYNIKAGEMKEAYQFLIISDFPTGMSDLALERLASIISSGSPCGVHVLMYHDTRQKWPKLIDIAQLRRNGILLKEGADGFVADHESLRRGRFVCEKPPETPKVTRLLERVGKEALEAKRVELAFSTAAPAEEKIWSRDTDASICVPIGRSGAVRLQEIELGRGTCQHALIAGRTGSGKSTLFHVLITNTALWFHPGEVEFYLIDFKKGVEFKTYANHRLPHARVIAIESDREFGVAVLKRLDQELNRRGELFRKAGVQDLPSYRKTPDAEKLPRTVLLIDEFQEYFTEDDAVSQEASLLLDRFVRQGRAFGVHVVLGSQTLSGVYSLAKSTLGQMGVRIALQCNESDSYLILSEDNAAARLLSRPGEAIYNDMSGLVEGNNPFQIVWLPDKVQANHLSRIAKKTEDEDCWPSNDTIVFEGNAPARLEKNTLLKKCLEAGHPSEEPVQRVWLGEPNAIKGPTEAKFVANGGSHLLVLGQRKDAAFGMFCSSILSLASRLPLDKLRLILLDGSGAESDVAGHIEKLKKVIPHGLEVPEYRQVPDLIKELDTTVMASQEAGEAPQKHTFLFVYGLQRFRALRSEDDFSMSFDKDEGGSTGEQFANILREGPEQQVHAVIWCDTLANANRAISRRNMREFDQRVLFQMSAADSSEIIDTPAANNLGLHNALLYIESAGSMEKFRPYALPDEAWLETVRMALHARFDIPVRSS